MIRRGVDTRGFQSAIDLLLDGEAYSAWMTSRGEAEVPVEIRRALADFLSVVGGDGTFRGASQRVRQDLGDGSGWIAPSQSQESPGDRVWHAFEPDEAEVFRPRCGAGRVVWGEARRLDEVTESEPATSSLRWCAHAACQKALVR